MIKANEMRRNITQWTLFNFTAYYNILKIECTLLIVYVLFSVLFSHFLSIPFKNSWLSLMS